MIALAIRGAAIARLIGRAMLGLALLGAAAVADYRDGARAWERGDFDDAFQAWLPLAEAGDAVAQNSIGYMYRRAFGVAFDEAAAAQWYRRAADQGLVDAMTNIGFMHDEGRGVERDWVQSYKWFLLASRRGIERAAGHLQVLEDFMTPEQIVVAKALAAAWRAKPED